MFKETYIIETYFKKKSINIIRNKFNRLIKKNK